MKIHAIEIEQNGVKLWICAMQAKLLALNENVKVDYYSAGNDSGYQRKPTPLRYRDFARYIRNARGISPNSLLINVRGEIGNFEPIAQSYGILNLPDTTEFWIVDGQHRIQGLRELVDQDKTFADFLCPVIIMNASSEYEEAKQFMIINKTQKGVKSDLAERFISKMSRREGTEKLMNMPRTTIKDIEWRPRATDIVDILNTTYSDDPADDFFANPWYMKIQLPNEPRGTTTISQGSFEDTLKHLLDNPLFTGYGIRDLSIILVRYWSAILEKCPNARVQANRYVLQRTTGTAVLHRILPRVVSLTTMGGKKLTKENIKNVLDNMIDGMDEIFWSSDGTAGVIGTSQKAWAILTSKVLEFLEDGNAEQTAELNKPYEL